MTGREREEARRSSVGPDHYLCEGAGTASERGASRGRVLVLLLCAAFALAPPGAAQDDPADPADPASPLGPLPRTEFKHTTHVPDAWAQRRTSDGDFVFGEATIDCQGCHLVTEPTGLPAEDCARCHFGGFASDGGRAAVKEVLFRHAEHAKGLFCRTCHVPRPGEGDTIGTVPPDMPVVTGTRACLACHGPQAESLYSEVLAQTWNDQARAVVKAAEDRLVGVLSRLNTVESLAARRFEGRGFFHGDHLPAWPDGFAGAADWRTCLPCHEVTGQSVSECERLAAAGAGAGAGRGGEVASLGEAIFATSSCGSCHIRDRDKAPVEFELVRRERTSLTAGTFSHRDHLANPAPKDLSELVAGREQLTSQGCFACHALESGDASETFGYQPGFLVATEARTSYDACLECHPSWTVESTSADLREVDHATIRRETERCSGCHRLGFVSDMKSIPFPVEVERPRGGTFLITRHVHDFITNKRELSGGASRIAETCSRCHVADLAEQSSRIRQKRFSHATHLPAAATAKDCETCHPAIAATTNPAEIATDASPLYDAEVCGTCHKGTVLEVAEPQLVKVAVPIFGHADHVGKELADGTVLDCVACHTSAVPDGEPSVGVLDEAKACVGCHNHEEFARATGGVSQAYVEKCVQCHKTGVPASGDVLPGAERVFVAANLSGQHHPDDQPCADCHGAQAAGEAELRLVAPASSVFGTGAYAGNTERLTFHKSNKTPNQIEDRESGCLCCHWAQQTRSLNRYKWPPGPDGLVRYKSLSELREDFPNDVRSFPGLACCEAN